MIEIVADLLIAILLASTITWCVLLYRQLNRLRVSRSDVETFVSAIDAATQRAEAAIAGIRNSADEAQKLLAGQHELVQQRAAELARLIDNGGRTARRLEATIHHGARTLAQAGSSRETAEHPDMAVSDLAEVKSGCPAASPDKRRAEERAGRPKINAELLKALEALR